MLRLHAYAAGAFPPPEESGRSDVDAIAALPPQRGPLPGRGAQSSRLRAAYKQMIGECLESGEGFGVVLIREGSEAGDPSVEPHQVGSLAEIVEVTPLPFGRYYVSTIGRERFRIRQILSREPYLTVDADLIDDSTDEAGLAQLKDDVRDAFLQYLHLVEQFGGEKRRSISLATRRRRIFSRRCAAGRRYD